MTVYTPSAAPAYGTWPERIESVLSLADRLFIGAVVNLPAEQLCGAA
jgi:hypothetical protein